MRVTARRFAAVLLGLALSGCSTTPRSSETTGAGLASAAAAGVGPVRRIHPELVARNLGPADAGVLLITDQAYFDSNALAVRMGNGSVVLASSPYETQGTRAMLEWLRSEWGQLRGVAFNTHFHFDGTGGNAAYRDAGIETYASELTQTLLQEKGESMRAMASALFEAGPKRTRVAKLEIVPARYTFGAADGLSLVIRDEEVRVLFPGPAHAPDNVVVWFPARRLLFGGCMVKTGDAIGYLGDSNLERWEAALKVLQTLEPEVVVPGHGAPGGPELLDNTVRLVRAALAEREKARTKTP